MLQLSLLNFKRIRMSIDIKKVKTKQSSGTKSTDPSKKELFGFLNKDISFSKKKLSDKKKERFYAELAVLLKSGIDIKTALEIIIEGETTKKRQSYTKEIKNAVVEGGSLSSAIKGIDLFTEYEYYSLRIGEESGNVVKVLKDLADFYAKRIEQRRKVVSTFSYPVIVMVVAVLAVVFMLNFIVPMFRDVFGRFGGELPALTQLILDLSDGLSAYGIYFLIVFILIMITLLTQKKKQWFRNYASQFALRIPFVGELIKKIYIARFSHSMHLLSQAKNPLLNSIQLVKKMVSFYPLEKALDQIEKDVMYGDSLYHSMEKHSIFDKKMTSLIKVGEEVNQLELIFKQIDEQFQEEIEHQTQVVGNLLEPILIIFVGGFVAVILIAMYLPLFQLGTSTF